MNVLRKLYRSVEAVLDSSTMYRVVVYALAAIIAGAFVLSATGYISYSLPRMALSLAILLPVSYGTSRLFAYTFRTKHNPESWLITALILFLLVLPPNSAKATVSLGMIALLATASKYLLAIRGRHLFNPAAVAVVVSGFVGLGYASWWVSTPPLLPAILVAGGLVVWKTRRFAMVGTFLVVGLATIAVVAGVHHRPIIEALTTAIKSYPLLFLASIMLTEPLTAPSSRRWQIVYAALVGVLAHAQLASWLSPEFALVLGNLVTFATGPKRQLRFTLQSVQQLTARSYEIMLRPEQPLTWRAGQYVELSLPHLGVDSRGIRRMFSIASSPAEGLVRLGIGTGERLSSFKQTLLQSPAGTELTATLVAGNFVLDTATRPLVFLAGGIGITPFRAMVGELVSARSKRPVHLLYFARTPDDFVWQSFFAGAAQTIPLSITPVVTKPDASWTGASGLVRAELLSQVPDLQHSTIYISGPPSFVENATAELRTIGVHRTNVRTDYFSGY